jgi:hypothetical protein
MLTCPFLIAHSVFSNVYFAINIWILTQHETDKNDITRSGIVTS